MKDWQKGKMETLLKEFGKEETLKTLEAVKEVNDGLEIQHQERFWTKEEIEEAHEEARKWQ